MFAASEVELMSNTNNNKPPVMGTVSGLDPVSGERGGRNFSR